MTVSVAAGTRWRRAVDSDRSRAQEDDLGHRRHLPQLLTIDQLAEQLNVSVGHVRRLVAERRVPYLKVGQFVRFDASEIAAWLGRNRVAG